MSLFIRIDDRLIHGQVVEGWVPHLKAKHVVVASDEAAGDETSFALMRMALPERVHLAVLTLAQAADFIKSAPKEESILVLVPGPAEALTLLKSGAAFDRINVGGLHYSAGRIQLGKAVFLSDSDTAALREIAERGVFLEGRGIPGDTEDDILALIEGRL